DVYKTEPRVTAGRRTRNINRYTHAQLEGIEKRKSDQANNSPQASTIQQDTLSASRQISLPPETAETDHPRQRRRITTEAEKTILAQLFEFEEKLPETAILKVMSELQTVFSDWTVGRVRQYWRNNQQKK
ncbi:10729_t:CDS:1, partial [Ambispora gerdemannii]